MNIKIAFAFLAMIALTATGWAENNTSADSPADLKSIPASAEQTRPLGVGAEVPSVTLQTADKKRFDLKAAVERQPSVLIFYRGGWCPYCNIQLSQLQTIEAELRQTGYQILAISPDRPEKLTESGNKHQLAYTLLSDHAMRASLAFGIAFRVDGATLEKYKGYGIDLNAASGETHHLLPVPAVFIVGTDGIIKFSHANPDYTVRLAPGDLLNAARAALDAKADSQGQ